MDEARVGIRLQRIGSVALVVLDRAGAHNALNLAMLAELERIVETAGGGARALVLASDGPHFCVGADLEEVRGALGDPATTRAFLERFHRTVDAFENCPVPIVVAVNGLALAGGLELALACDLMLVASDAQVGDQHVNVGLVPGGGGSQRLPRAIGPRLALALQLTGERLDAAAAVSSGLAYKLVPGDKLREVALAFATELAAKDPEAVRRIRDLSKVAAARPLREGLKMEVDIAVEHLSSDSVRVALSQFFEDKAARNAQLPKSRGL